MGRKKNFSPAVTKKVKTQIIPGEQPSRKREERKPLIVTEKGSRQGNVVRNKRGGGETFKSAQRN